MKRIFIIALLLFTLGIKSSLADPYGLGVRTVYSSTNVGTTNWVVLVSSVAYFTNYINILDSSGQTLELGTCAVNAPANSEVRQLLIPAGGVEGKLTVAPGQRISIRAISGTASTGENDFNLFY